MVPFAKTARKGIFQYGVIGECPLFRRIVEKSRIVKYLKDGSVLEVLFHKGQKWYPLPILSFWNNTSGTNPSFKYLNLPFVSPNLQGIKIMLSCAENWN